MKRKLFLVCLFLTSMAGVQAQNLLRNGDFKDGTNGWNLGTGGFTLGGDASYPYLQTGYVDSYDTVRVATDGQTIDVVPGGTYVFSFWANGLRARDMKGNFSLKETDGSDLYNIEGIEGVSYNAFSFSKVREENGWTLFEKKITFPKDSKVAKIIRYSISVNGSNRSYKKLTDISIVELKSIENVEVTDYQREAVVTWTTATGVTSYDVKVGDATPTTVTEAKYLVTGLEPGSTTTITVSAQGFSPTEVVAKTMSVTTAEAQRIPYVKFDNGVASTSFYPYLFDTNNAPTEVKVFLDGQEVTAGADGFYTLTVGDNKKLKVTFKDGTQDYELMYVVTVK